MEQASNKTLTYRHISSATDEIITYIQDRKSGKLKSLKTRWAKFNNTCMGGIEPNTVMSVVGISGSGKSSFVNSLETDLIDLNKEHEIVVLSFNFEMLSSRQVGRKLSAKLKKTTSELYSGSEHQKLTNQDIIEINKTSDSIRKYPIYYADSPGTVEEIGNTIDLFNRTIAKDKWLVVILDHILLTKGNTGEGERAVIQELQKLFMQKKKEGKTSIIQLSQMNRNIEETSRITNPNLHFPQRNDLFGSDSIFQASDLVIVLHRPEILQLKTYGPNHWEVENIIYMHILKNREGDLKILKFKNNLKHNTIEEIIIPT